MKTLTLKSVSMVMALTAFTNFAHATDGWGHESEVAVVNTGGNTESESYSARQKTTYTQELNVYTAAGRYLQTKTKGVESAKSWDAGVRYERTLSDLWSIFMGYGAEADPYAGFIQRDSADVGGKYYIRKSEPINFFTELGYRLTKTQLAAGPTETDNFGRLYLEYAQALNPAVSFKLWVEYLPNFSRQEAYLANAEPSLNVMLNSIFSLKTAYLVKYKNEVPAGSKNTDTTFTTSLVARF